MQKKLIALAVAAVISAPAFADVTPYGIVDGAIASIAGDGVKSQTAALSGGASTSRLGVKVTEDLGDGLTAVGVIEYGLDIDTNQTSSVAGPNTTTGTTVNAGTTSTNSSVSNLAARQQMLALAGSFGTVATGYLQTTGYDFQGKFDPLAGSSASPLQSMNKGLLIGTVAGAARAQRALAYISPDFNGLSFAVNYSTAFSGLGNANVASTAADVNITATLASVSYAAGPLAVGAVYAATSNPASVNDLKEYALGGSYDLGVAKLMATYQANTTNTATSVTTKALSLSGVVPVGADAVAVSYAKNTSDTANAGGSGYTVGYLHTLSKTTTVYAAYESITNESGTKAFSVDNNLLSNMTVGGSSSLIGVGMRKKF
jgi:predicted porin